MDILFRGFHPDENGTEKVFVDGKWIKGKWVEGASINKQIDIRGKEHIFIGLSLASEINPKMVIVHWKEVVPETVGQYINQDDYDKTKIFTGDFVRDAFCDEYGIVVFDKDEAMFVIRYDGHDVNFGNVWGKDCEIIGNIHSNPELLEVGI